MRGERREEGRRGGGEGKEKSKEWKALARRDGSIKRGEVGNE